MPNENTSPGSLKALRNLRIECEARGDHCLAVILGGVELYASLGRELDLIEAMKQFADDIRDAVHQTPSARELQELFDRDTWKED
jgi:hypothetical protein